MKRIYLDYAASAPIAEPARQAMIEASMQVGNPSSQHQEGRKQRALLDEARSQMADRLGCLFGELHFTSGATESAQLAMIGTALANPDLRRNRILVSAVEHHCVLGQANLLGRLRYKLETIPVDEVGRVRLDYLESALDDSVLMVAVMHANNEIGTWQPAPDVAKMTHDRGALFLCDCAQTVGAVDPRLASWNLSNLGADLACFSGHKWGGPQGTGALFIRAGTTIEPVLRGGGQEREMRAGTENLLGIVGMSTALSSQVGQLKTSTKPEDTAPEGFLAELDRSLLKLTVPHQADRLPNIVHLRVPGLDAETMVIRLDQEGIAIGSGAACSSGSLEPSHVLLACGYSHAESKEGLRFSFGPNSTVEEATEAAHVVNRVASELAGSKLNR